MEQAARNISPPGDNALTACHDSESPTLRLLAPLAPGTLVDGRYLIERELGRGGIGIVFLARDRKVGDVPVVLKVLLERRQKSEHRAWFEKQFHDEIKALARINHPGVIRARDAGQLPDGRSYLVMDYVPGGSLRTVMEPRGMDLKRAGKLLDQIASALDAAHEQGVIHRDLKPENILLQQAGGEEYVRLIDFGMAKVRKPLPGTSIPTPPSIAGTMRYMAPEQLRGKSETASDIYALGVIGYEMVTGQPPFNPATFPELEEMQQAGVRINPRALRPDLPEVAEAVILRAIAFNAADRFASARAFSEAFSQAIAKQRHTDSIRTAPFGRKRPWLLLAAVLLALLAAAAMGTIAWLHFLSWGI